MKLYFGKHSQSYELGFYLTDWNYPLKNKHWEFGINLIRWQIGIQFFKETL